MIKRLRRGSKSPRERNGGPQKRLEASFVIPEGVDVCIVSRHQRTWIRAWFGASALTPEEACRSDIVDKRFHTVQIKPCASASEIPLPLLPAVASCWLSNRWLLRGMQSTFRCELSIAEGRKCASCLRCSALLPCLCSLQRSKRRHSAQASHGPGSELAAELRPPSPLMMRQGNGKLALRAER